MKKKYRQWGNALILSLMLSLLNPMMAYADSSESDENRQSEIAEAEEQVETTKRVYEMGGIVFLDERIPNEKYRYENWIARLRNSTDSRMSEAVDEEELMKSFSFDNLRKMADLLDEYNEIRAKDTCFSEERYHRAIEISPELVMSAKMSAMISYRNPNAYHPLAETTDSALNELNFLTGENLSWGQKDPFEGWYADEAPLYDTYRKLSDAEKKSYDTESFGHYINVMMPAYEGSITGFGIYKADNDAPNYAQRVRQFPRNDGSPSYTSAEWRDELNRYEDELQKSVRDAEARLDELKSGEEMSPRGISNPDNKKPESKPAAASPTKPGKCKIYSVKRGKRKLTVKWKKPSGNGLRYQIGIKQKGKKYKYYRTSGKSKTIKKLKSRKYYYVRVRAYRTSHGKNYYGKWSSAKKTKIK